MPRLLVVDDEAGVRESLRLLLENEYDIRCAESVDDALRCLQQETPDLILLDLVMPERNGMELLETLRGAGPPVVVLSATRAVDTVVDAMKLGAVDFVTKPFEPDALGLRLRQILERRDLEEEVERLRDEVAERRQLCGLIGRSAAMRDVFRWIERAAAARATVMVTGESGTGKELVAKAIHECSPRKEAPFVAVNCAAIPDALLESELFGHEKGAFTDARERRIGKFESATGGTLFLDEIAELAGPLQAKLLRALQEQMIDRVGGREPVEIDVRVVAATNRDLREGVENGTFRADLFYRINVLPIALPPLRERSEDVPLLAEHFLSQIRGQRGPEEKLPEQISDDAMDALRHYPWPGNVRELENVIERAVALGNTPSLGVADLPEELRRAGLAQSLGRKAKSGELRLEEAVGHFERTLISETLLQMGGNQTQTAKHLGITRRVLKLKMDRYGLSVFPMEHPGKVSERQ